ncbi:hypothetical protein D8674_031085 [Pyrus ussuriensis x Pyrus communis]|uniref:Uncharacterized protein n=1 Tax=Pyrus ussuriensis x Pyrus communis TaxID=2448454 RepID=A0A5N5EY33_9ROSA|nr:hypothetical protein D8674_031085 [Pyrus ussuriensis x Pyrus communis]
MAQPANLVDQLVQNPTIEEPIVYPVIDPQLDAVVIAIGPNAILVKALADSVVSAPLSNLKTIIAPFILDEEV